jgi:transposase InsO family protein
MTETGDPLENAVAERVTGIIKEEYLENYKVTNIKEAKKVLDGVIKLYNDDRPHMSIGNLSPNEVHNHSKNIQTKKLWKNYYNKYTTFVKQWQD